MSFEALFDRFLDSRGVRKVKASSDHSEHANPGLRRRLDPTASNDDSPTNGDSEQDSDLVLFDAIDDIEDIDFFQGARIDDTLDADRFYSERSNSFQTSDYSTLKSDDESESELDRSDRSIEYVSVSSDASKNSDSPLSLTSSKSSLLSDPIKLPRNSVDGLLNWEFHDPLTTSEIQVGGNGGIYDTLDPGFSIVENSDPSKIVKTPPGEKFMDSTKLESLGIRKLFPIESMRKYKNNLSIILTDKLGQDYLVVGSNSELFFFNFNSITHMPNNHMVLRFDSRPSLTSTTDRLISTWPYFPHTINYLKVHDNFLGRQVFGACIDDGMLLLWFTDTVISQIEKFSQRKSAYPFYSQVSGLLESANSFYGLKVKPDFRIKLEGSLWGLDFLTYQDNYGISYNLIIVSDNSRSVTLFYYHEQDGQFYHIKTHQVLHNIPDVSFLNHEIKKDGSHCIKASCVSIYGELIVFKFRFRINLGPLKKEEYEYKQNNFIYYVDPTMEQFENRQSYNEEIKSNWFKRILCYKSTVIHRTLLGEDCWSTRPINSRYFKTVQSIRATVGDPGLDESSVVNRIIKESKVLDGLEDPVKSSNLGISAAFQFFEAPVVSFTQMTLQDPAPLRSPKLTTVDDDYRRIRKKFTKHYVRNCRRDKVKSLNGRYYCPINSDIDLDFLLVSTSKRLGLFRGDSLFCNCATSRLFDLSIPFNDESKSSNRISIAQVIPQLLCYIAVTQQGLVSIMRLCKNRGVFGMRQEHIFPNALSLALGYHGYRTIAGLTVRDVSVSEQFPVFIIYIIYTDGIVISSKLTASDSTLEKYMDID